MERGMPIGIVNIGGVRGEEAFFHKLPVGQTGQSAVRIELGTDTVLPGLVEQLQRTGLASSRNQGLTTSNGDHQNSRLFRDMLS